MSMFKGNEKAILMTVFGSIATLVGGLLTSKGTGDLMGNEMQKSFLGGLTRDLPEPKSDCDVMLLSREIEKEDINGELGIGA